MISSRYILLSLFHHFDTLSFITHAFTSSTTLGVHDHVLKQVATDRAGVWAHDISFVGLKCTKLPWLGGPVSTNNNPITLMVVEMQPSASYRDEAACGSM